MDLYELFGPSLKQQKVVVLEEKVPTDVHIRAVVLVVDCSELGQDGVHLSPQAPIAAENVVFLCTQQWKKDEETWGRTSLPRAADPVRNLSARKDGKRYLETMTSHVKKHGVTAELCFHSSGKLTGKSRDVAGICRMVRTVAPLTGPLAIAGVNVGGISPVPAAFRDDIRVALVKGLLEMYTVDVLIWSGAFGRATACCTASRCSGT
jgi:hypothetical protein